ncbi:PDDEXK nuclease domain-containing protein [Pontiellaceae bacterium B12219]|nr:PDDEXK nuclease domain-containing protein [Pontiellaceae bacterium B12219]
MNEPFNFESLVSFCGQTHEAMQRQAARSVNISLVVRNWLFGWYMVEYQQNGADRAEYGERFIDALSKKLNDSGIKGCSTTNLRHFRAFFQQYAEIRQTLSGELFNMHVINGLEIQQTVSGESASEMPSRISPAFQELTSTFKLSWSHYVVLLSIDNPAERSFYEIEAAENSWSVRELERQIGSSLYERLALSRDKNEIKRLAREGQVVETAADLIKNPLVLEFLALEERAAYSEAELETAIIDQLEQFLLELGKGFLFEARQKRFTFDNDHYYVDLVFYNRLLRCYVLLDLKRDKLTHQDLGQMQMYVNHFDRHVKTADEAPTIGIVLCHRKNDALVELTLPEDANIYASKYQLYLPSKEELQQQLESITRQLEDEL